MSEETKQPAEETPEEPQEREGNSQALFQRTSREWQSGEYT